MTPGLGVTSPLWLVGLVAVVPVLWSAWRMADDRPRALAAAGARALALVALVLALAGLHVERLRPATGGCVVAVVDVSASVGRGGLSAAREFLRALLAESGPEDLVGTVAFAGNARVVAHPAHGPHGLAALLPADLDVGPLATGDTDLAAAIARATPLCPEDRQAALVLFTDGNETTGNASAEVALGPGRLPLYAVLPPPASLPPAGVRRVLHPAVVPARSTVPVEVVVEARTRTTAALLLESDGGSTMPLPLDLPPGLSIVSLPLEFPRRGVQILAAKLLPVAGAAELPAPPAAAVAVTRPLRVLMVSEREAPVVAAALAGGGLRVDVVRPEALAAGGPRFATHHLVVLDDVGSARMPRPALTALAEWVRRGGGLVVAGGPHLFGDPGFVGTALERLLPVELRSQKPEPKQRDPIAIYVLIDRSNSMGYATGGSSRYGEKMEYAKRAALAVLEQLGPSDLVGAIAFDAQPYQLGPLLPLARGGPTLVSRIRALQYGGGTDFKEALETALTELLASGRRVRHVILLTDGDTNRRADDHLALADAFANAGITVTAVRIGADAANLELLETIARRTGGEFHHVENLEALPQLMIRDAQRRLDMAADRRDAVARFGAPGRLLAGLREEDLPPLARWATTRQKPGSELRLYVERDARREPILATWQLGLGRVAALPLDFQAGAAGWAAWPGFGRLLAELALWAAPAGLPSEQQLSARHERAGTRLDLVTLGDAAGPFALRLPGQGELQLRPVSPRHFTALAPHLPPGRLRATLRTPDARRHVDLQIPPTGSGREYRTLLPNEPLLRHLTTTTGGTLSPTPSQVIAAPPSVAHAVYPLTTILIAATLLLLLGDIALRR